MLIAIGGGQLPSGQLPTWVVTLVDVYPMLGNYPGFIDKHSLHGCRGFFVWKTVDDGSDVCVSFSSRFELGFRGGGLIVRGSVVVLRESSFSRLIAVARSMSWFFAVETFSFFHKFLMFRGHRVDIHGVWIPSTSRVLVGLILSIVLVEPRISSQGSHESSPVVIKKNGFVAPLFDCFRDSFHGHDSFDQFWFQGFLVEVDENSMIRIVC